MKADGTQIEHAIGMYREMPFERLPFFNRFQNPAHDRCFSDPTPAHDGDEPPLWIAEKLEQDLSLRLAILEVGRGRRRECEWDLSAGPGRKVRRRLRARSASNVPANQGHRAPLSPERILNRGGHMGDLFVQFCDFVIDSCSLPVPRPDMGARVVFGLLMFCGHLHRLVRGSHRPDMGRLRSP